MRTLLITLLVLALFPALASARKITADPNAQSVRASAPEVKSDPRLLQKVTYKVRLRPVESVLADLSQMSGVKFHAGSTAGDWRVREDVMTIHAVDIQLGELMNSISRVMKFAWVRTGDDPDWTYRLIEDRAALGEVRNREESWRQLHSAKRQRALNLFLVLDKTPAARIESLRDRDPDAYKFARSDAAKVVGDFMRLAPQVTANWIGGRSAKIKASDLSDDAYGAYVSAVRGMISQGAHGYQGADNDDLKGMLDEFEAQARATKIEIEGGSASNPYGSISLAGYSLPLAEVARAAEPPPPPGQQSIDQIGFANAAVRNYTAEDHLPILDQPSNHEKLKKKIDSEIISRMVFQLAEASGCAVVTDNFRGKSPLKADETRELGDVIEQLARMKEMNWQRTGGVIEMWNRDWHDRRVSRVSRVWLDSVRRKFTETGTLDLADLADIANLSDKQFSRAIQGDRALKQLARNVQAGRDYMRLYASLSKPQRSLLLSAQGLGLDDLSDSQRQAVIDLASDVQAPALVGIDLASSGIRLALTRTKEDDAYSYILRIHTDAGTLPVEYAFKTPTYIQPKPQTGPADLADSRAQ